MSQNQIKEKVLNIIRDHKIGVLSSVENNKPHSRYMTFFNDDLTLYTPTSGKTEKIDEIEKNPNVHILIGYDNEGLGDSYLEISGTSKINDSQELKDKLWNESFEQWFEGPKDPNYLILQIKPESIRLMNNNGEPPQELSL
ncbi:pyridoxamine 5'-phosphate oxidase family protein [Peribacillus frigoritolerans]|jgi:general stress protein 26|uniref:Pyridoxamine 5'-phosphate oxidase family protein n=1 Tax=Peribacillus frigoritolerans TaxID=450367 RepID=A0AAJ1QKU1_9BACI|nr:pyridoxamine 5'-phosphate oxidase family protein [Peribacillus frigoritolerans]MCD1162308.1 pyridoxamine 5'-phosphate oxidase family protein [Peribacillus castrilensis]QYF81740.1 pyridoxamine 5'-phosphate oxidase family protein [Brevibacterium sp. PAMC21349]MCM3165462.1 pyridoxamine 5'-phosphate oxidase family protein [Peribacillus frigoritolerans]MDF1998277.1 pyridoxamine 5'-phosphate oxidase family protein [Peribacillus frigoritolerans]MDM5283293.1 pyridoxamine 5'-phosphate oxidase family